MLRQLDIFLSKNYVKLRYGDSQGTTRFLLYTHG